MRFHLRHHIRHFGSCGCTQHRDLGCSQSFPCLYEIWRVFLRQLLLTHQHCCPLLPKPRFSLTSIRSTFPLLKPDFLQSLPESFRNWLPKLSCQKRFFIFLFLKHKFLNERSPSQPTAPELSQNCYRRFSRRC